MFSTHTIVMVATRRTSFNQSLALPLPMQISYVKHCFMKQRRHLMLKIGATMVLAISLFSGFLSQRARAQQQF